MKKLLFVTHDEKTTAGTAAKWAESRGIPHRTVLAKDLDLGLPYDAAIIFGGDVEAWEEAANPWLKKEKAFIRAAVAERKPLFGVCLGAQLIAEQLGSIPEKTMEAEKGWFPKQCAVTGRDVTVLSWHASSFALPRGASLVAGESANECQGFSYGNSVVGYQFHTEIDEYRFAEVLARVQPSLSRLEQSREDLVEGAKKYMEGLERWFFARLDEWARPSA